MKKIYNELCKYDGKLLEFADHLVYIGLYSSNRTAREAIRHNVRPIEEVTNAYMAWKPGRLRTKDMATHINKTKEVFKEIKQRTLKSELNSIVDVMEEALKELTIGIKNMDKERLLQAKELLSNGLYGTV